MICISQAAENCAVLSVMSCQLSCLSDVSHVTGCQHSTAVACLSRVCQLKISPRRRGSRSLARGAAAASVRRRSHGRTLARGIEAATRFPAYHLLCTAAPARRRGQPAALAGQASDDHPSALAASKRCYVKRSASQPRATAARCVRGAPYYQRRPCFCCSSTAVPLAVAAFAAANSSLSQYCALRSRRQNGAMMPMVVDSHHPKQQHCRRAAAAAARRCEHAWLR